MYVLYLFILISTCMDLIQEKAKVSLSEKPFGNTKKGESVTYFELSNTNGMTVGIIDYGATVTKILVPDKNGNIGDVVLGHDNMHSYEEKNDYFGCIAGRYANRIGNGTFTIDGKEYQVPKNNSGNALHGGIEGFDKKVWNATTFQRADSVGVVLTYLSKDGEEGYPGELLVKVTYSLGLENSLRIDYKAITTRSTVLNLTNHSYFNLKDGGKSSILDHKLMINAPWYTPVDEGLIATGEILSVEGSPFDFQASKAIGDQIEEDHIQLTNGMGYDHNFVINKGPGELGLMARVYDPVTGRVIETHSTEPGIQFYSGNFLNGEITGKYDVQYNHRSGFCLETQHFPDSPNKGHFPSVILEPEDQFNSTTIYKFSIK